MSRAFLGQLLFALTTVIFVGSASATADLPAPKPATDAAGFVTYWIGLEHIDITVDEAGGKGLDKGYVPGEAALTPVAGEKLTVAGTPHTWKLVSCVDGNPKLDCDDIDGVTIHALSYVVAYVVLEKDEPAATIQWSADDGAAVFVNGKEVARSPKKVDNQLAKGVALKKGVNVIMFKLLNVFGGYDLSCRLVDSNDHVMANVPQAAAPAGKPAPANVHWLPANTKSQPVDGSFSKYFEAQMEKKK